MLKPLKLSIIIPVYNEESYLQACLESIVCQTVMPDEVIVVNNNSTDGSAAIARKFKFVTLIRQPKPGLIAARNAGFEHANGDLLARIDADSVLDNKWVARAKHNFQRTNTAAVTGPAFTVLAHSSWLPASRLWSMMYFWWTEAEFGIPILWGANMVVRSSAWRNIRQFACLDDTLVHEDQDLSFVLAGRGHKVVRDNKMTITTDGETYHEWTKFSEYVRRRWQTRRYHRDLGTLESAGQNKLAVWQRLWRIMICLGPGTLFILTSIPVKFIDLALTKLRLSSNTID